MNAAALLLIGAQRHYAWALWDDSRWQSGVWNICAALAILSLLAMVPKRGALAWAVAVWFAAEELLVVGCATAQLLNPLPPDGTEQCTSHTGMKLGAFGLVVMAILAWRLRPVRTGSCAKSDGV